MLFAESETALTWVLVAGNALTMIGVAWASFVAMLTKRDQLRFDADAKLSAARVKELEAAHSHCEKNAREIRAETDHIKIELSDCQKQHAESTEDRERMKRDAEVERERMNARLEALEVLTGAA